MLKVYDYKNDMKRRAFRRALKAAAINAGMCARHVATIARGTTDYNYTPKSDAEKIAHLLYMAK